MVMIIHNVNICSWRNMLQWCCDDNNVMIVNMKWLSYML